MRIINRIVRIASTNVHDLLDGCESPTQKLRQATRDLEAAVEVVRPATSSALAHVRLLGEEVRRVEAKRDRWHSRAVCAMEAGDESLARQALLRREKYVPRISRLRRQVGQAQQSSTELLNRLTAMRKLLHAAQRKLALLESRHRAARACERIDRPDRGQDLDDRMNQVEDAVQRAEFAEQLKWDGCTRFSGAAEWFDDAPSLVQATDSVEDSFESIEIDRELQRMRDELKDQHT